MHQKQVLNQRKNPSQINFWKKLRLLKRCCFCRNRHLNIKIIKEFLESHDVCFVEKERLDHHLVKEKDSKVQLRLINQMIVQSKGIDKSEERLPAQQIEWSYKDGNVGIQDLKEITHYYRFFQFMPVKPKQKVFNQVIKYEQTKKRLEYKRIQQIYSLEKFTKSTASRPTNPLTESQKILKNISEAEECETEMTFQKELKISKTIKKSLEEIDKKFTLKKGLSGGKKNKKEQFVSSMDRHAAKGKQSYKEKETSSSKVKAKKYYTLVPQRKQNKEEINEKKKKNFVLKKNSQKQITNKYTRRQYDSCGNLQNLAKTQSLKISPWKIQSRNEQKSANQESKIKQYIIKLKEKIKEENIGLKKNKKQVRVGLHLKNNHKKCSKQLNRNPKLSAFKCKNTRYEQFTLKTHTGSQILLSIFQ